MPLRLAVAVTRWASTWGQRRPLLLPLPRFRRRRCLSRAWVAMQTRTRAGSCLGWDQKTTWRPRCCMYVIFLLLYAWQDSIFHLFPFDVCVDGMVRKIKRLTASDEEHDSGSSGAEQFVRKAARKRKGKKLIYSSAISAKEPNFQSRSQSRS